MVRQTLCLKMADKYHQHFRGGIVGKWKKFRPFSNNLLWLFENGRKQTINHLVGILLEKGRNFCRFLTTTTSCLKTAENKPSTILWGLCWKTAEISAVFQQLVFGRFPTTQNVSAVFQQRGFGRFPTIFFGRFPHPRVTHAWIQGFWEMRFLQYDGRHFTLHEGNAEENGQVYSACHYWKAKQPLVFREAPAWLF